MTYVVWCGWTVRAALEDINAAIELDDEYEGWHILRGSIYYAMGKVDQAEENFERAAELNADVTVRDEGSEASKKEIDASLQLMTDFPWTPPE